MCHHYVMCIFQFCWAIFSYTTFAFANSAKEKARTFVCGLLLEYSWEIHTYSSNIWQHTAVKKWHKKVALTRSKKDGSILSVCISVGWNEYSRYWELHSDTENLFVKTRATAEIDSFEGSFEYLSAPPKCLFRHKTHSVYLGMYRYLGIRDYHIMAHIYYKVYILEASGGAQLK